MQVIIPGFKWHNLLPDKFLCKKATLCLDRFEGPAIYCLFTWGCLNQGRKRPSMDGDPLPSTLAPGDLLRQHKLVARDVFGEKERMNRYEQNKMSPVE